jgi:hypothetical protein
MVRINFTLVNEKKNVRTPRVAWMETERVLPGKVLSNWLKKGSIQGVLGLAEKVPEDFRLKLALKLKRILRGLKTESWFVVDEAFVPTEPNIKSLQAAYAEFCLDPVLQKKIPPEKGDPSDVDISLLLYSAHEKLPLLTNDEELFNFSDELAAKGLCHLIKPFRAVQLR